MWPFTRKKKQETPTPAEVILEVQEAKDEVGESLRDVFLAAAKEAAAERARLEAELLSSGKLQGYLKNTMRYMASEVHKQDNYDFFLIHHHNVKVPSEVFGEYARIFLKIAGEFNIRATLSGDYIKVDKEPLLKAIKELMPETPPVDMSALRESLRTGPYR